MVSTWELSELVHHSPPLKSEIPAPARPHARGSWRLSPTEKLPFPRRRPAGVEPWLGRLRLPAKDDAGPGGRSVRVLRLQRLAPGAVREGALPCNHIIPNGKVALNFCPTRARLSGPTKARLPLRLLRGRLWTAGGEAAVLQAAPSQVPVTLPTGGLLGAGKGVCTAPREQAQGHLHHGRWLEAASS